MTELLAAAERFSLWITPVLLFTLAAELLARGAEGLWIALLVVVAPLLSFLLLSARREPPPATNPAAMFALAIVGVVLLWSNLLFAGQVAGALGFSRVSGVLVTSAVLWLVAVSDSTWRWGPALALPALVFLFLPLGLVVSRAERGPLAAWSHVASLAAFRFPPKSPWVTEGRPVSPRRGIDALTFEEEHRIAVPSEGSLRILVNDAGRASVQERILEANQPVTLRPGDRLVIEQGRNLRFEAGKRIPGAPDSGVSWAEPAGQSLPSRVRSVAGLGLTVLGGAAALLSCERSTVIAPVGAAIAGAGYLLVSAWAQGWATYAAALAPEIFLGGVTPEKLFDLPALALLGSPWATLAFRLLLLGGFCALLASATALRGLLAGCALEGRDLWVWGGMLGGAAVLASVWPLDPWGALLLAFGLAGSTLGPVRFIRTARERPGAVKLAVGAGVCVFLAVGAAGQIMADSGGWIGIFLNYPALVAAPATAILLRAAR